MLRTLALLTLLLAGAGNAVAGGTLRESASFHSPSLGRDLRYSIYLPPAYGAATAPFPVLLLMHGPYGRETDWESDGGDTATLDRMIADGTAAPMVVVMPDGGNSWYVDSASHGAMETAIQVDLRRHVETHYAVRRDRDGRFVAGLSMGGYGALRFAFRHPGAFRAAASLSAAIFPDAASEAEFGADQIGMFSGAFGEPFDLALFNRLNIFGQIDRVAGLDPPLDLFLLVGDDDGFGLYRGTLALYLDLKARQAPVELRVVDGDHTWSIWRTGVAQALAFFTGILRGASPGR